jgi:hypothetical protein
LHAISFPIPSFCCFERNKRVGCGSLYCGHTQLPYGFRAHSDASHVPTSLVQPLFPSLAQNFARTHNMKFKRHYLFLKVCKKFTMQGVWPIGNNQIYKNGIVVSLIL